MRKARVARANAATATHRIINARPTGIELPAGLLGFVIGKITKPGFNDQRSALRFLLIHAHPAAAPPAIAISAAGPVFPAAAWPATRGRPYPSY